MLWRCGAGSAGRRFGWFGWCWCGLGRLCRLCFCGFCRRVSLSFVEFLEEGWNRRCGFYAGRRLRRLSFDRGSRDRGWAWRGNGRSRNRLCRGLGGGSPWRCSGRRCRCRRRGNWGYWISHYLSRCTRGIFGRVKRGSCSSCIRNTPSRARAAQLWNRRSPRDLAPMWNHDASG